MGKPFDFSDQREELLTRLMELLLRTRHYEAVRFITEAEKALHDGGYCLAEGLFG